MVSLCMRRTEGNATMLNIQSTAPLPAVWKHLLFVVRLRAQGTLSLWLPDPGQVRPTIRTHSFVSRVVLRIPPLRAHRVCDVCVRQLDQWEHEVGGRRRQAKGGSGSRQQLTTSAPPTLPSCHRNDHEGKG